VRRAIACRIEGVLTDGAQAINYLTSHDVEGDRKERPYNLMKAVVSLASSEPLFDRSKIDEKVRNDIGNEGADPFLRGGCQGSAEADRWDHPA
jgi:hypothetical protein